MVAEWSSSASSLVGLEEYLSVIDNPAIIIRCNADRLRPAHHRQPSSDGRHQNGNESRRARKSSKDVVEYPDEDPLSSKLAPHPNAPAPPWNGRAYHGNPFEIPAPNCTLQPHLPKSRKAQQQRSSKTVVEKLSTTTATPTPTPDPTIPHAETVYRNPMMDDQLYAELMEELTTNDGALYTLRSGAARNTAFFTTSRSFSSSASSSSTDVSTETCWRATTVRDSQYYVLVGTVQTVMDAPYNSPGLSEHSDSSPSIAGSSSFSISTAGHRRRFLPNLGKTEAKRKHNALIEEFDWTSTALGDPNTWSPGLMTVLSIATGASFPILLLWGPEFIITYNEPYSKAIGKKHPAVMGQPYRFGFSEIWDKHGPVLRGVMQKGEGVLAEDQELFLLKKEDQLEETFFSYSMIGIRNQTGEVEGVYIPCSDNTTRVITERRIASLHEISREIAHCETPEELLQNALKGMTTNPRDINFVVTYTASPLEDPEDEGGEASSILSRPISNNNLLASGKSPYSSLSAPSKSRSFNTQPDVSLVFSLCGVTGCLKQDEASRLPSVVTSDPLDPPGWGDSFEDYMHNAHIGESTLVLSSEQMKSAFPGLQPNTFGDYPRNAVILPIRSSPEDRIHGMLIIGLNTRRDFNEEYRDYINLIRRLLATSLASVKLHGEEMARASFLAALNRQKNEQLQAALAARTEDLRKSELKFTAAFEASPVGLWIADPTGRLLYVNQEYLNLAGLSRDDPPERWLEKVHPDDLAETKRLWEKGMVRQSRGEFRYVHDDKIIWVEGSGGPTYNSEGQVVFITGTVVNVNARKENETFQKNRAEQALEQRKLHEQFIDMTSHEIRNPLSALQMADENIAERLLALQPIVSQEASEEISRILEDTAVITMCTTHMRRLVDDVLALSKLDSGMVEVHAFPCQPTAFFSNFVKLFEAELASKHIQHQLEILPGYRQLNIDWVKVDSHRCTQILVNLLTNAIKFTTLSEIRHIRITMDAANQPPVMKHSVLLDHAGDVKQAQKFAIKDPIYLIFSVADTGPGIDSEESSRLFRRWAQGGKTHSNYTSGSGLGLFICKRLTTLLGGNISLESEVGVGSTFTFFVQAENLANPTQAAEPESAARLPQKAGPVLNGMPSRPRRVSFETGHPVVAKTDTLQSINTVPTTVTLASSTPRPIHVLLTEDNVINQKLLAKQLIKAGFLVSIANNGVEALNVLTQSTRAQTEQGLEIDVCLMDIEMPVMDGNTCVAIIRTREKEGSLRGHLPIVAVTGNARDIASGKILESGMDSAIAKPFKTSDLLNEIRVLVDRFTKENDFQE